MNSSSKGPMPRASASITFSAVCPYNQAIARRGDIGNSRVISIRIIYLLLSSISMNAEYSQLLVLCVALAFF